MREEVQLCFSPQRRQQSDTVAAESECDLHLRATARAHVVRLRRGQGFFHESPMMPEIWNHSDV